MAMNTVMDAGQNAIQQGEAILQTLDQSARDALGMESGNIKFIRLLGNPYRTSPIISKGGEPLQGYENVAQTIGALFEAQAPCKIPVVPADKKPTDTITASELTWKNVQAGEQFALTLIETFLLAIMPNYSLYFGADAEDGTYDAKGCKVVLKWAKGGTSAGAAPKIPTATFSVAGKILRKETESICTGDRENPVWTNPIYAKFAPIIVKAKNVKTGGTSQSGKTKAINDAAKTALYCTKLMNNLLQSSAQ